MSYLVLTSRTLAALALVATAVGPSAAQAGSQPAPRFGITDNSFLVEEAFNQEAGIFQNIFVMTRSRTGVWNGSFTQEWPVTSIKHQLSVTVPISVSSGSAAIGDVLLNYRYQAWSGEGRLPAFAPRLSGVLPTSADRRGFDASGVGWQMNLPFSKQAGSVFVHANVGATMLRPEGASGPWETTPSTAGSVIVAVRPMFNLMFEAYRESRPGEAGRETSTIFAPGFRTGWNVGDQQWVIGVAVPVTRGAIDDRAILGYVSYELPFRKVADTK